MSHLLIGWTQVRRCCEMSRLTGMAKVSGMSFHIHRAIAYSFRILIPDYSISRNWIPIDAAKMTASRLEREWSCPTYRTPPRMHT